MIHPSLALIGSSSGLSPPDSLSNVSVFSRPQDLKSCCRISGLFRGEQGKKSATKSSKIRPSGPKHASQNPPQPQDKSKHFSLRREARPRFMIVEGFTRAWLPHVQHIKSEVLNKSVFKLNPFCDFGIHLPRRAPERRILKRFSGLDLPWSRSYL